MEHLTTATEQPTTTMEQPNTTTEQPAKTVGSPTAAMKQPTTTMEQLTSSLPGAFPSLSSPPTPLSIPLTTSLAILANIIRTLTHDATILDTQLARHAPATEASDLPPLAYYYFHNTVSNYLIGADPTLAFVPEEFKAEMQMVLWVVVWWYAMVHCGEGVREKVSNAVVEECIAIIEGDEGEEMVVVKKVVGVWKAWMDRFVEELVAVGEVAKEEKEKKKTSNEVFEWGVLGLMVLPSLLWGGLVRGY
ncbi:hypothetical protein COCCADRAFT_9369 [Bipolaris zeicola 26-R-13]|uniref:Uncharacterized protein n=1 Tax=Cochliobolus carbonum (strain 26-R-13) TaxID=930089 RepID=W6XRK6_COCC2|nr:uncharacterized protein COCCADRAFT_9369 [Bipolaris zeicola 26-R-13]EUC28228.1 hypothetical protein COCCADRAFT_9369 [Bipolaris zeicola 26-R-13]